MPPDLENNQKLLNRLNGKSNRQAQFVCVLCFVQNHSAPFFYKGFCKGAIATEIKGKNGFGYDGLFVPENQTKTFAQAPETKLKFSHRSEALNQIISWYREQS